MEVPGRGRRSSRGIDAFYIAYNDRHRPHPRPRLEKPWRPMVEKRLRHLQRRPGDRTDHAPYASAERSAVVLDDHCTWTRTIAIGSWLRSNTRTSDGGFQGAVALALMTLASSHMSAFGGKADISVAI